MIWSRRHFLQALTSAFAAAAVAPALSLAEPWLVSTPLPPRPPPPAGQSWLYELCAWADVPITEARRVVLSRNGTAVFVFALQGQSMFRWVAGPGEELLLDGLENESDVDLRITMCAQQGDERYSVGPDGVRAFMGKVNINSPYRVPTGSFTQYIERESLVAA